MNKRQRSGSAFTTKNQPVAKRGPGAKPQMVFVKPQKSLRFQANTVGTRAPEKKEITNGVQTIVSGIAVETFTAITAASLLNGVVQGTTAETRIGRKIRMRSLDIRWTWNLQSTSTGGSPVRCVVVYDKQSNAAAPTIAQIFNTNDFLSPMLLANSDRFIILRSFISEPVSLNNNLSVSGHEFVPIDLDVIYNDTNGGTILDIQTGSAYLMIAQNGSIGTAGGEFTFISRIRFDDN